MIYLVIQGACGNQFFQYAFARALQEETGQELAIDWRYVKGNKNLWNNGENVLKYFNTVDVQDKSADSVIQFKLLQKIRVFMQLFHLDYFQKKTYWFYLLCAKLFSRFGLYFFDASYFPFKIAKTQNIVIQGYFEAPKYFEKIDKSICGELTSKQKVRAENTVLYSKILNSQSVCVTIKRFAVNRDTIKDVYAYDIQYFYNAMKYIKQQHEDAVFFIFSDDIPWCKQNLKCEYEMYFESGNDEIWEKISLMSSCKHFIIHNSTFSWWAQHLSTNENKIVIAPEKWMNREDQPIDIYEENWIYQTKEGDFVSNHL